jgi:hypothetical protein
MKLRIVVKILSRGLQVGTPDWDTFHLPKFSAKNAFA